jgi:hypothetical protein
LWEEEHASFVAISREWRVAFVFSVQDTKRSLWCGNSNFHRQQDEMPWRIQALGEPSGSKHKRYVFWLSHWSSATFSPHKTNTSTQWNKKSWKGWRCQVYFISFSYVFVSLNYFL